MLQALSETPSCVGTIGEWHGLSPCEDVITMFDR